MELSTVLLSLRDTVDRIDRLMVLLEMTRDMENYEPDRAEQFECMADAQLHYAMTLLDTYEHGLTVALEDLRSLLSQAQDLAPQPAVAKNLSGSKRCASNGKPIE